MRTITYAIHLLILLVACSTSVEAATDRKLVDTTDANIVLKDIQMVLNSDTVFCFSRYIRTHVDSSGITKDSSIGSTYRFLGDKFRYGYTKAIPNPDAPPTYYSIYHIQNDREYITVDTESKTIVINKRVSNIRAICQLDLLDQNFVEANVQRMYAVDSAGFKVIKVEFKPESPYLYYKLWYDPATLLAQGLKCVTKYDDGTGSSGYDEVKIEYDGYNTSSGTNYTIFLTDEFYTRKNGAYILKPSYADYEIIDLSAF